MVTFDRLTIGVLFVAAAVLACLAPAQSDTWWHLRAGQDIWRTHVVSLADSYSYTAAGRLFPNHEWLTEVLFYALYRLGGMTALSGACASAIVLALALSWRLAQGPFEVRLVTFLALIASSTVSWALRPQVLSMAFLMTVVTLLVKRRTAWLPVLFFVWANAHGAVALGLLALLGAIGTTMVVEQRVPWRLALTVILSFATTFVTPLGVHYWPEIVRSIERSRTNGLIEWTGPGFAAIMWPFWVTVIALLVVGVVRWKKRLAWDQAALLGSAAVVLPLALRSIRNVPMFMLLAAPAVTTLTRSSEPPAPSRLTTRERWKLNAGLLAGATVLGAAAIGVAWTVRPSVLGWQPLSPRALQAIRSCPDPIYNTYEEGGALIWFAPDRKVFIDNRQDPYPAELLASAHQVELTGNYQTLFQQFAINCAIVPPGSPTAVALRQDRAWRPTYADAQWAVFQR